MQTTKEVINILDNYLKQNNMNRKIFCFLADIPVKDFNSCLHDNKELSDEIKNKIIFYIQNN